MFMKMFAIHFFSWKMGKCMASHTVKKLYRPLFLWSIFALLFAFQSCNREKEPKELFEEQQSGVCIVLNSYYYEITLPNNTKWYCSGIDEEGDLENFTMDLNEILQHKQMQTGTAFFIDKKGKLLTNRHVVNPAIPKETVAKVARTMLAQIRAIARYAQEQYVAQYQSLEEEKNNCIGYDFWGNYTVDEQRLQQIEQQQQELSDEYDQACSVEATLQGMDMTDIRVTPVNEIGIAYNDTYVTQVKDFTEKNPCVVTKVSTDENTDLALIELKSKVTPTGKYIFKIKGYNADQSENFLQKIGNLFSSEKEEDLEIGQELTMIGFNAGLVLGNTRQGIQAQMTIGNVSQKPDGDKVLYSIPTLNGSSGSPVIDNYGYVRAVNFAKLSTTDNFNFGIPEKRILKFLKQ